MVRPALLRHPKGIEVKAPAERPTVVRCAVYTRKSSEEGLEQSFNSLHAQREACEAYIVSQRHEGWQLIHALYDDGGFSGGTMERPALQRLLADIAAKKVDTIVVYKVDRLTRSLADFAKIVEALDQQGVSFVSVTQQFNTTTSMGRLTLNVLLSFAQFEREVTGERIRDKIAASKRKGMWMGGVVPLGYECANRGLVPLPDEVGTVKEIFAQYLRLRCVSKLQEHLEKVGIRSKSRVSNNGTARGGSVLSRGALYGLLQNRIYLGEITHRGASYPGQLEAIIDRSMWDAVQQQFAANRPTVRRRVANQHKLTGLLFDREGNRFVPSHANKRGRRYRYYVSQVAGKAPSNQTVGPVRIPATELESLVLSQLQSFLRSPQSVLESLNSPSLTSTQVRELLNSVDRLKGKSREDLERLASSFLIRVIVDTDVVRVRLSKARLRCTLLPGESPSEVIEDNSDVIEIEAITKLIRYGGEKQFVLPPEFRAYKASSASAAARALSRAHSWVERILRGEILNQRSIAKEEGLNERYVSRIIPLAFLAPDITEAILNGSIGPQFSLKNFPADISADWMEQRAALGR
jgi:DNA invertase Pin-like site-specific DNA recombinase